MYLVAWEFSPSPRQQHLATLSATWGTMRATGVLVLLVVLLLLLLLMLCY